MRKESTRRQAPAEVGRYLPRALLSFATRTLSLDASAKSKNTDVSKHSRQSVPQNRSILPSIYGRRGEATM